MITTPTIDCDHIKLFCRICNRKFSIRNITCCPQCSQWRQVCQACGNLEECSALYLEFR